MFGFSSSSSVELEEHDVAVLHDIFLAFVAGFAGFFGCCFAAKGYIVIKGDGLGADEAAFEIGMDDTGGLWGLAGLW